ncbi:protein of unknown function DUF134 [Thermovibrio ammonificans HB-1]|uniref:Regulatory protein, FmdB family n=1 Tax=Thermovibrio ammonificans (strain DSM 15698 / JCM 12110 / HB-1) TaxID=648996 RepID=E8T5L3_THEA1|nr:hypothetical protein [Thermovibrio ammonificans]ADU96488.1 protein of unknown function DUF134 [Thermovibrio ammonificans HB-1]
MEALPKRKFQCLDCGYEFEEPFGKPRWMVKCPKCGSENVVRADAQGGWCRGGRGWGWRFRGGQPERGFGRGRGGCGRGRDWGWGWRG